MSVRHLMAIVLGCVLVLSVAAPAHAQWRALGPFGGNARALAYDPFDPSHILLGSGGGALFESADGGRHWRHLVHLGPGEEMMLEDIAFDASQRGTVYVAGWSVTGQGGGLFLTRDGGRNWSTPRELWGKSIQALALAESTPGMVVAGALDGLYRSVDWGASWQRITPAGHPDLKNFESVAIDPRDARIIYAGTWHLPWKTSDGGAHWSNMRRGIIDDSDVFSIIVDHSDPRTVFASACSGIYKSENRGEGFRKIQGIPGSARRTRVLQQDPSDPATVYAGTTEGLWKTMDGGKNFRLITPADFILNDVLVDPRNPRRVLIATDRGGVYASDDAGQTFVPSNEGFSQRQISSVLAGEEADELWASVLNDKQFGGIFHLRAGEWRQMSEGLEGRDVFDLRRLANGEMLAATNHGLFLFSAARGRWEPSPDAMVQPPPPRPRISRDGRRVYSKVAMAPIRFEGRASALAVGLRRSYAATDAGVLVSDDAGKSWRGGALDGERGFYSIAATGSLVAASSLRQLWLSRDEARHWQRQMVPSWVSRIYGVTFAPDGEEWLACREGALRWNRELRQWQTVTNGLPAREITSLHLEDGPWLATSAGSKTVYVSRDHGQSWQAELATGLEVSRAALLHGKLYLTTAHHGLLQRKP